MVVGMLVRSPKTLENTKALHVTKKDTRYRPISVFTELFWKKEFYDLKIYMYQDTDYFFLIITPKGN